jgi:diaminopimelate epimerase
MCANGARCFAQFANQLLGGRDELRFETLAGLIRAEFRNKGVQTVPERA